LRNAAVTGDFARRGGAAGRRVFAAAFPPFAGLLFAFFDPVLAVLIARLPSAAFSPRQARPYD